MMNYDEICKELKYNDINLSENELKRIETITERFLYMAKKMDSDDIFIMLSENKKDLVYMLSSIDLFVEDEDDEILGFLDECAYILFDTNKEETLLISMFTVIISPQEEYE